MIKIKAGNARNSRAIAKLPNAEVDYFKLKLIVHVLIRGSLAFGHLLRILLTGQIVASKIDDVADVRCVIFVGDFIESSYEIGNCIHSLPVTLDP